MKTFAKQRFCAEATIKHYLIVAREAAWGLGFGVMKQNL